MPNEAEIRDYLANNLSLIEPELEFIDKEVLLKNEFGAGGRIDILARDKFGIFVIIEIKKINKTAREAIHELLKYISLFQTTYGLSSDKCRCILLSTEWHELIVPFSTFSRSVSYHVDGYQLILDGKGIPIKKKRMELISEGEEKFIFPLHHVFLFESEEKRKKAVKRLEKILKKWGVQNYYSLSIDYRGVNSSIIMNFAQYLAFYMFSADEQASAREKLSNINSHSRELLESGEYYEEEEYLDDELPVEHEVSR
jgi:hypothetical protein